MMDCRTVLRRQSIRRPLPFMSLRVTGSSDRLVAHSTKCLVPPACLLLAPVPPAAAAGVAQLHSVTQRKDETFWVTLSVPLLFILNPKSNSRLFSCTAVRLYSVHRFYF